MLVVDDLVRAATELRPARVDAGATVQERFLGVAEPPLYDWLATRT